MSAGQRPGVHPQPPIPVRVTLPAGYLPCPACGQHYTRKGRVRRSLCARFA